MTADTQVAAKRLADAALTYYWAEFAGAKTEHTPAQVRELFADAVEEYREAIGADRA